MKRTANTKQRGFTLIELLVVIGIVSILAAALFPAFVKAREQDNQAGCAGNEKQLGVAFLQYAQDHDQTFPDGSVSPNPKNDSGGLTYGLAGYGWVAQIYPYVKSKSPFRCPDDPNEDIGTGVELSYFYNPSIPSMVLCNFSDAAGPVGVRGALKKFTSPAKTVLLGEAQSPACLGTPRVANIEFGGTDPADNVTTFVSGMPYFPSSVSNGSIDDLIGNSRSAVIGWMAIGPPDGEAVNAWINGYGHMPDSIVKGVHNAGSNFLCADGHVKWLAAGNVSIGQPALTPGAVAVPVYGAGAHAEGTQNGTHTLTFSPV